MLHLSAILLATALSSTGLNETNWDYPNTVGQSGKFTIGDKVIATSYSKQSTDSFRKVVSWYAERTNLKTLPKDIDTYRAREASDPDFRSGSLDSTSNAPDGRTVSTAVYAFTPKHMHVTIVVMDTHGDTVSLSIAGSDESTTINIVRRIANRNSQLTTP